MQEMQTGSHERMLVSPLSRSSLLVGRALKEVVPMLDAGRDHRARRHPVRLRLHLGGVLVGAGDARRVQRRRSAPCRTRSRWPPKDQDWLFWTVQQTLIFPLLLLSGMLLPLDGAPGWLQVAVDANPLTYVVDAERALFAERSRWTS